MHTAMKEDTSLTHEQVPPPRHPSNCAETMCDRVNPFGSRIDGKSQNEIMNPFFFVTECLLYYKHSPRKGVDVWMSCGDLLDQQATLMKCLTHAPMKMSLHAHVVASTTRLKRWGMMIV